MQNDLEGLLTTVDSSVQAEMLLLNLVNIWSILKSHSRRNIVIDDLYYCNCQQYYGRFIHWFDKWDKGKKSDKTLAIWGEIFLVRRAISLRWFIESLLKRWIEAELDEYSFIGNDRNPEINSSVLCMNIADLYW